jgi:hypothetical protein
MSWAVAMVDVVVVSTVRIAMASMAKTVKRCQDFQPRHWYWSRPAFRVYFEVVGRVAAGQSPFAALAAPMTRRWIGWLEAHLTGPAATRQRLAAGLLANSTA